MKSGSRFQTTLALLLSFLLTNCSKSSDPAAAPTIIGTWKAATYSTTNCTTASNNVAESQCTAVTQCPTIVISATTITSSSGVNEYSVTGNNLTVTGGTITGTFTVSATTLSLTYPIGSTFPGCINNITYIRL